MRSLIKHIVLLSLLSSINTLAIPRYERTMIPFPPRLDVGDEEILKAMLQLDLYQDFDDKYVYYYKPPFHVQQYAEGATSPFVHKTQVESFVEVNKNLNERDKALARYYPERIAELKLDVAADEENHRTALARLREAVSAGISPEVLRYYQSDVDRTERTLERHTGYLDETEQDYRNKVPPPDFYAQSYINIALHWLRVSGFAVQVTGVPMDILLANIQNSLHELGNAYGGFMAVNIFGGFTQKQLEAIRLFKAKYAPKIRIALLPVDNMSFFPLTETIGKSKSAAIFRQILGSGDYLGATVNFDLSVNGAIGFATHLSPFILPIGITGDVARRSLPTQAKLSCNFTTGFNLKSRKEIRPQFIVFGREIINDIKTGDINDGTCNLKLDRGDKASAEYKALLELDQILSNMFVYKTTLSQKEKAAYYNMVANEAQANPQKSNTLFNVIRGFITGGILGAAVEGLSSSDDTFWQVSEHDVENLSKVKFTKEINIQPDEVVNMKLSTKLCLVYNLNTKAYDRCTEEEQVQSDNMSIAISRAYDSPPCVGINDPFECGQNRDRAGINPGKDRSRATGYYKHLPMEM